MDAFDRIGSAIDYYALDVDRKELDRTLDLVKPGTFEHVRCHGLCGTYDDFVDWVRNSQGSRPLCLLSLGSTIGSFSGAEAADFLRDFAEALEARDARNECSGQSLMLIGIDGCKDGSMVWHAYNDGDAANDRFIRNCLDHANTVLGSNVFEYSDWDRIGNWNAELGRHEQFLIPKRDVRVDGVSLKAGKKILVVCSHKFDADDRDILWREAGLKPVKSWTSTQTDYGKLIDIFEAKALLTCHRVAPCLTKVMTFRRRNRLRCCPTCGVNLSSGIDSHEYSHNCEHVLHRSQLARSTTNLHGALICSNKS